MAAAARKRKSDPARALANAILAFRAALSQMCRLPHYRGRPRNDAVRDLGFCLRRFGSGEDPDDVLDGLLADGVVAEVEGRMVPASRTTKRSREERQASFDGWVRAVSERATGDTTARALLETLIRRMTRLHGVHRVTTPRGEGILIASRMAFVAGQPCVVGATAIIVGKNGLETYEGIDGARLSCTWSDNDWPLFECDIAGLRRRSRRDDLMYMRLVGKYPAYGFSDIINRSGIALRNLLTQREDIEAFIGLTLPGARWNGLRMSLGGSKSLVLMARKALLGMLVPEVRRIALRHPYADFAFYYWIRKCSEAELARRIQMSDAFPAMTYMMRDLDEVIREGRPLLPALQSMTGIDIPRLKRLRGVHWQRMGYAMRSLIPDDHGEPIDGALRKIPSTSYPSTKKEWCSFFVVSHWEVLNWLAEEQRAVLLDTASRNWVGYADLARADFARAVTDCAENLLSLVDLHLTTTSRSDLVRNALRSKIIEHVCGANFGIKRMRLFNEAWHKGAGQRGLALRSLRRSVFGEEQIATWKPLTEGGFTCASGRLVWMTDEDQLLFEGQQMSHCVGSYWSSCVQGTSHIAQVHGFDGSRSTVEFTLSETGRVSMKQHHTYGNGSPTPACAGVVSKFLSDNRKNSFPLHPGDGGSRRRGARREKISIDAADRIRNAYADCISSEFLDFLESTGRRWRSENPDVCIDVAEAARRTRANRIETVPQAAARSPHGAD